MNLLRMYKHFVVIYLKGKLAYHGALIFELIANTIQIGIYFAGFMVIFHNFDNIAGWNQYEVLFMFTTSWLAYSFSCFFFWSPMKDMGELIRSGKFDLYLTRPIRPLLYMVLSQFQYTFISRLLLCHKYAVGLCYLFGHNNLHRNHKLLDGKERRSGFAAYQQQLRTEELYGLSDHHI